MVMLVNLIEMKSRQCSALQHPTNERQNLTLKVLVMDVIAILGIENDMLPVLQVGGHSSPNNG